MREPGFEEFADLWQESGDSDRAALEALARKARRQARLLGYADAALLVLICGGTLITMLMSPQPATIAAAILIIFLITWLTWRRRRLRQMATTLDTNSRDAFLESSIRIANANLRRVNLSLGFLPFAILAGLVARFVFQGGGHLEHPLASAAEWGTSPKGMIALTIFVLLFVRTNRSRKRLRAELQRLEQLRRDYED